nr:hypothetical protein CFP56_35828 [Quercus suber]
MTAFSVNFQSVPIWVQVWGLLLDLINEEAGRDIARAIGRVLRWIARQLRRTKRGHESKSCTVRLREGEETPYGEWLRVGFQRPKFQQTWAPPTPPRRDQGDTSDGVPLLFGHNPETINPPHVIHVINGIDEAVTDT